MGNSVRRTVHECRTLRVTITHCLGRGLALQHRLRHGGTALKGGTLRATLYLRCGSALAATVVLADGALGRGALHGVIGQDGLCRPETTGKQQHEDEADDERPYPHSPSLWCR